MTNYRAENDKYFVGGGGGGTGNREKNPSVFYGRCPPFRDKFK